jgi:glycosyltransferase involved in cell wall biosynthesis
MDFFTPVRTRTEGKQNAMKQPLKILHLVTSLTVGGAEQVVLSLVGNIDWTRFESHVCSLSVVSNNALQPEFERLKLPVMVINAKRFYDMKAFSAVRNYIRHHQIDIVHTHLTNADITGGILGRLTGTPVLSTLHNMPRNYNRQRWDRRWLLRFTFRYLVTRLVAVSQQVRNQFIEEWHVPAARMSVIRNAIRMDSFLAVWEGKVDPSGREGPIITNVGRLSPQKAQHLLLAAAKLVLEQRPDAHFMIVGQGHLEQRLKEKARALGIADHVTFTGLRHDIPAVLAQTDVFVLSSLWEGMPISAIEAMAAARPVVLTRVGGNSELVEPGKSGLLVPPGDVEALAEALLSLLQDEPRRWAMGRSARARVQRLFNVEAFTQAYENLYELLADRGSEAAHKDNVSVRSGQVS